MSKQVICIDDKNISRLIANQPKEGVLYSIRQLKRNINGTWGLLLNEIRNPSRNVPTEYGFPVWMEPNFGSYRFQTLDGNTITDEMCEDLLRRKTTPETVPEEIDEMTEA